MSRPFLTEEIAEITNSNAMSPQQPHSEPFRSECATLFWPALADFYLYCFSWPQISIETRNTGKKRGKKNKNNVLRRESQSVRTLEGQTKSDGPFVCACCAPARTHVVKAFAQTEYGSAFSTLYRATRGRHSANGLRLNGYPSSSTLAF